MMPPIDPSVPAPVPAPSDAPTWAALLLCAHRRYKDARAVLTDDGALTYAQVFDRACRVAAWLHKAGAQAGDRVILAMENRPEVVVLERALALWGWVRVAVSARLHAKEIDYIAADCEARFVFCETRLAADFNGSATVVSVEPCAAAQYVLDDIFSDDVQLPVPPLPAIGPDDLCSLMYTSGTTGRPKGAMNTHRAWHAMASNLAAILPPIGPGDVLLHLAPMSHFSGSIASAYAAAGAMIATERHFTPADAPLQAAHVGATCIPLVPTMLNDLTRALRETGRSMPRGLKVVPYGGSSIAPRALIEARAVLGEVLMQIYGASEALVPVTSLSIEEHASGPDDPQRLATAGRPHPAIELRLSNVTDGVGEICVRGANVMTGYWGHPQQTAEVLDADGWYCTGDLGRFDVDGRVGIVGRKREMLISGGFNIYPAEIERVIAGVPGVAEVAVIGVPHARWGEAVKAYVVSEPGAAIGERDVIDSCLAELGSYKKPLWVEFVAALPRTSTGKVDKRSLAEQSSAAGEKSA